MTVFQRGVTSSYERSKRLEWILTNGLGGYASSTIIGVNTRAYHGLLVAALNPPLKRTLLLSKLEEQVAIDGATFPLSVNRYPDTLHPEGHRYLVEFSFAGFPIFTYSFNGVVIRKKVFMQPESNTTIVKYEVQQAPKPVSLSIYPLVNCRDHGARTFASGLWGFKQNLTPTGSQIQPYDGAPLIFLKSDKAKYAPTGCWYRDIVYDLEAERGYPDREDTYNAGMFTASLNQGEELAVVASDHPVQLALARNVEVGEVRRGLELAAKLDSSDEFLAGLARAADQFIVSRPPGKTVIAGYPWFADWARDALISLPGLTLVARRFQDAKAILTTFFRHMNRGLVPAFFMDEGPMYASADSSLWLFTAVYKYLAYTRDYGWVKENFDRLEDTIEVYSKGAHNGVHMTRDGLIEARFQGTPLTWMDVVVDGHPVTLRAGKAVEVNALWYNALRVMAELARTFGMPDKQQRFNEMAATTKRSFNVVFWDSERACLFDCVEGDGGDESIRPNQIFAVSLPFEVLTPDRWGKVVEMVQRHLLTPFGLRTLAPSDKRYRGEYAGDPRGRDEAYHQGTVWPWLLGPFVTAFVKSRGGTAAARQEAMGFVAPLKAHLAGAGLGTIPEVFDGDPPHSPGGCIAQAWSVAEVSRSYYEDVLNRLPAPLGKAM